MEMYHGSQTEATHLGMCFTDDIETAGIYAEHRHNTDRIIVASIDLDGLTVDEVDRADTTDDGDFVAPGDDGETTADVLVFGDLDQLNNTHVTYRLMTEAALAAVTITAVTTLEEAEAA